MIGKKTIDQKITQDGLFTLGFNKYNTLKTSGKWGTMTPDMENILAVVTGLHDLKSRLKLLETLEAAASNWGNKN